MIYVSSSCIKKNRISEVIRQMAEAGVRNIELSGGTDYYEGIEQDLKALKEMYQLQYACHAYFPPPKNPFVVNLASCNDEIYRRSIEHYNNCIELLKRINCDVLSVHAGFLVEISTEEIGRKVKRTVIYNENEAYSRFCYAYEGIAKRCRKENIRLYLENNVLSRENYEEFGQHNYFMMTDYRSIMRMKEQIDFNLLLDLGHLYVSSNTLELNYEQECSLLKEYVRWLHISENNGICDEHRPLKKDSTILNQFYNLYQGTLNVTLEITGETEAILSSIELAER